MTLLLIGAVLAHPDRPHERRAKGGHARETAGFSTLYRLDFVDVIEVQDRNDGRARAAGDGGKRDREQECQAGELASRRVGEQELLFARLPACLLARLPAHVPMLYVQGCSPRRSKSS